MLVEDPSDILRKIETNDSGLDLCKLAAKAKVDTHLPAHNCELGLTKQLKHMQAFLEILIHLNVILA